MKLARQRGPRAWQWCLRSRPYRTVSHFTNVGGSVLSAGMSYLAVFAVFGALWVGFGVFGIVLANRPELLATLVEQINAFVPGLIGKESVDTRDLIGVDILSWSGIAAAAVLLWVAMNWFTGTRRAIRLIFGLDVKRYRNPLLLKLRDFILAIAFGLAIVVSAVLTVASSRLLDTLYAWWGWNPDSWLLGTVGMLARYATMYLFDVIVLLAIHRFLAEARVPWRPLLAGCALGGAALLVLKILGSALLGGVSNNPLLASFAVIIGLLIWFNLICRTLLLTSSWIATGLDRSLGTPEP